MNLVAASAVTKIEEKEVDEEFKDGLKFTINEHGILDDEKDIDYDQHEEDYVGNDEDYIQDDREIEG